MTITNWVEYSAATDGTYTYENRGRNILHTAQELLAAVETLATTDTADSTRLKANCGPVCWHVAACCFEAGVGIAVFDSAPSGGTIESAVSCAKQVVEMASKATVEDNGIVSIQRRAVIAKNLYTICGVLQNVAVEANTVMGTFWALDVAARHAGSGK